MSHFSFTQVCRICKKSSKTFKISLSNYDENGLFLRKKQQLYFVCCDTMNFINFEEICNPFTVRYLRRLNEIDSRIDQVNFELMKVKMEKLKLATV